MSRPRAEVIGDPIAQSKSPAIHGYWLERAGIAADYGRAHVRAEGLAAYLDQARADPDWRGCNVTMPHKQAIIALLDRLDALAARIGAVNTVLRAADGRLSGHNTDAPGFLEPLAGALARAQRPRTALVLGTGGAARAIVAALDGAGVSIVLAGRDPAKARALLDQVAPGAAHRAMTLARLAAPARPGGEDQAGAADLVVNASPLGMAGQPALLLDPGQLAPGAIVYDIVPHPLETPLLTLARQRGCAVIDGLAMLIGQAAAAFALFYGAAPLREAGDARLRALLGARA